MNAINVAWKDIQILFKDRGQVVVLFLLPIIFILVFSAAYSASRPTEQAIVVPLVNLDPGGELTQRLVENLNRDRGIQTQEVAQAQAEDDLKNEKMGLALVIPAGFSADVASGATVALRLLSGPAASDSQVEAVRLVVDGVAADLALQTQLIAGLGQMAAMMSDAPKEVQMFTAERIRVQAESQFERAKTAPLVAVAAKWPDKLTEGRENFNPSSFSVASFAVMFAFLVAQTTGESIFREKKEGTFRRVMASPMSRQALLLGKMLPNFGVALLQVAVIFGVSLVLLPLLGMEPPYITWEMVPGLVLITVVLALCSTSLGILIAALARTESQVGGISTAVLWIAAVAGGAFLPAFILGNFLGVVGKIVPHYWALQAYNDLMIRNKALVDILPEVGVLIGFTLVFFIVGRLKFRFD
jgi:ABC-2 type transport system permease protein